MAVSSVAWELVLNIGIQLRWGGSPGSGVDTTLYGFVLPALILVLCTLGYHRIVGVFGFAWLVIFLRQHPMLPLSGVVEHVALQAAGFAALATRPRRMLPAGRLLWAAPAAVFLLYQLTLLGQQSGVGRITPALMAILLLPWAPALAIGTSITWGLTGLFYLGMYQGLPTYPHLLVEAIELSATVPLALVAAAMSRAVAAPGTQAATPGE